MKDRIIAALIAGLVAVIVSLGGGFVSEQKAKEIAEQVLKRPSVSVSVAPAK